MTAPKIARKVLDPEFAADAEDHLWRLGGSPTKVAQTLLNANITGVPEDPCRCVIAEYLRSLGFDITIVDPATGRVGFSGARLDDDSWHYPTSAKLPGPVRLFALGFDKRRWPALVRVGVPT